MEIETLRFLTPEQVRNLATKFGTPIYVYSQEEIEKRADAALSFPNAYGITVRYAMKANPNSSILKILKKNQNNIINIDRTYIQKFVKIHNYLKTKKENCLYIFNELKKSNSTIEKHDMLGILKNQINTYENNSVRIYWYKKIMTRLMLDSSCKSNIMVLNKMEKTKTYHMIRNDCRHVRKRIVRRKIQ